MAIDDLQRANFADLVKNYFENTDAKRGAKILARRVSEKKLEFLLRSPFFRPSLNRHEITCRTAVNDLLAFYSIIEIAFLCGALSELPPAWEKLAREQLSHPVVQRYYEQLQPRLLPRLLLTRLNGMPLTEVVNEYAADVFAAFLMLNLSLEDVDVKTFLYLLKGNRIGRSDITTTLRLFGDREKISARILRPPRQQTTVDRALHGFVKFSGFCFELDRLFMDSPAHARSAMWHFHERWFGRIGGRVREVFAGAIEQYRSWVPPITAQTTQSDSEVIERTHASIDRGYRAIDRLTSSVYRFPLERLVLRWLRVTSSQDPHEVVKQLSIDPSAIYGTLYLESDKKRLWDFPTDSPSLGL